MQREILFRGIRIDNGEWVYGYLIKDGKRIFIFPESAGWFELLNKIVQVIPESVGQFTGLLDKDGVKIFEGDILELDGGSEVKPTGSIIFKDGAFRFEANWTPGGKNHPELLAYTIFNDLPGDAKFKNCISVKVIGNTQQLKP